MISKPQSLAVTHPDIAKLVSSQSPITPSEVTYGTNVKLVFKCQNGHTYQSTPRHVIRKTNPKLCSVTCQYKGTKPLSLTHPELAKLVDENSPFQADEVTYGSKKNLLWTCDNGHTYQRRVQNQITCAGRCPECAANNTDSKSLLDSIPDTALVMDAHPELLQELQAQLSGVNPKELRMNDTQQLVWICPNASHTYTLSLQERLQSQECPTCNRIKQLRVATDEILADDDVSITDIETTTRILDAVDGELYASDTTNEKMVSSDSNIMEQSETGTTNSVTESSSLQDVAVDTLSEVKKVSTLGGIVEFTRTRRNGALASLGVSFGRRGPKITVSWGRKNKQ